MRQFSGNLLAILITLLLGLPPLQGAIISYSDSVDSQRDTHRMAGTFDSDMAISSNSAVIQDCGQCSVDDDYSHSSSSSRCTTTDCVMAPPLIASHPTNFTATSGMFGTDEGVLKQIAAALFRPPKI